MDSPGLEEGLPRTVKKRQACEPCRSVKAKCFFEDPGLGQCTNCIKFKRRCVIEDDRRYPRPSAESSGGLRLPLRSGGSPPSSSPRTLTGTQKDATPNVAEPRPSWASGPDVIDRKLLDIETATDAFNYFVTRMAHHMPFVSFPSSITMAQCRQTTPALFLAILLAASGMYQSNLQATLLDEFYKVLADQVMYRGQKRLELVQGILITWMWMPPPDRVEDMKFGLMAHLSAGMIQDLRLKGARNYPTTDWSGLSKYSAQRSIVSEESITIEGRRTLLATFCACAMLSVVLKRSTILPFNDFMAQSLVVLKESPEAMPNDKSLVAWVELERISMDLAEAKSAGLNSDISPGAENLKIWLARTFESRLQSWRQSVEEMQETLMIEYHTVMLYANLLGISDGRPALEPAFVVDMDASEFRTMDLPALAKFVSSAQATPESFLRFSPVDLPTIPGNPPFTVDMAPSKLSTTDLPAFAKCVSSAQSVLETFLRFSPADIPTVPGILFPRMVHALLILIVAASAMLGSSRGGVEQQIAIIKKDIADLAVIEYCDRVINTFIQSPGPEKGRATKAVRVLTLLKKWYAKNILNESGINLDASVESNLASAISQVDAMNNLSIPQIGIFMEMANVQSANTAAENPLIGVQPPNTLDFDTVMESYQALPLNEEQYAFFESLVEGPEGPPWTLFDDAMAVFDFI